MSSVFQSQSKIYFLTIALIFYTPSILFAQKDYKLFSINPSNFKNIVDSLYLRAEHENEFLVAYLSKDNLLPRYHIALTSYPRENECGGFLNSSCGIVQCKNGKVLYLIGDIDLDLFNDMGKTTCLFLPSQDDFKDLIDDGEYSINKTFIYDKHLIVEVFNSIYFTGSVIEEYHKNENPYVIYDNNGLRLLETKAFNGVSAECIYYSIEGIPLIADLYETRVVIKNKMLKPFSKVLEFREVYYDIFSSNGRKIARRYSRKNGNRRERPFEQNINEISYISPTLIYCFRLF